MATINDIGIPNSGTGILQPKLKFKWRATFTNLGGGADTQPVTRQCTTADRPKLSWEEVELHRYNSRVFVAGKHSWDTINIGIEDDIGSQAASVLQEQIQAQQYLTGVEGAWLASASEASSYKFTTRLDLLDGNEAVVERWIIQGCWIQNFDWDNLDYSATNSQVMMNLTLRFDHAYNELGGYEGGPGMATGT